MGWIGNTWNKVKDWVNDKVFDKGDNVDTSGDPGVVSTPNDEGYLDELFTSQKKMMEEAQLYNSAEALKNRNFQSNEAELQRNWQTQMSNTAYQRAMADMKAAGLNPILAYSQGGANVSGTALPTGSAASVNVAGGDSASDILSAVADMIDSIMGNSAKGIVRKAVSGFRSN